MKMKISAIRKSINFAMIRNFKKDFFSPSLKSFSTTSSSKDKSNVILTFYIKKHFGLK